MYFLFRNHLHHALTMSVVSWIQMAKGQRPGNDDMDNLGGQ